MKNAIQIIIGTMLTTILIVFTLGVINGSGSKQYTVEDIPGVGWTIKVSGAAGRSIGERMKTNQSVSAEMLG